jgi:hypothetical protein
MTSGAMVPSLAEIEAAVARMEARLESDGRSNVVSLMRAYRAVATRFRADLSEPRDAALACSGALMLVQQVAQATD